MEPNVLEALKALRVALQGYARARGSVDVAILKSAGLREMRISVRALYRYHEEDSVYSMLDDAIQVLLSHPKLVERELRVRLFRRGSTTYLIVPLEVLEKLMEES